MCEIKNICVKCPRKWLQGTYRSLSLLSFGFGSRLASAPPRICPNLASFQESLHVSEKDFGWNLCFVFTLQADGITAVKLLGFSLPLPARSFAGKEGKTTDPQVISCDSQHHHHLTCWAHNINKIENQSKDALVKLINYKSGKIPIMQSQIYNIDYWIPKYNLAKWNKKNFASGDKYINNVGQIHCAILI